MPLPAPASTPTRSTRPTSRSGTTSRPPSSSHRLAWLAEHLPGLDSAGIVYTLTVAQAEAVAAFLRAQGLDVASYTGRTETADRLAAEQNLIDNKVKALIATSALGMGFD